MQLGINYVPYLVCHFLVPLQMVQYEVTRKELLEKQQRKVDEMDKRAAELQRHKAENDAAWVKRQQEFELTKMREEQVGVRVRCHVAEGIRQSQECTMQWSVLDGFGTSVCSFTDISQSCQVSRTQP